MTEQELFSLPENGGIVGVRVKREGKPDLIRPVMQPFKLVPITEETAWYTDAWGQPWRVDTIDGVRMKTRA